MIKLDYVTDEDLPRRVQVLSEDDNPDYGIPADVFEDLEAFYKDRISRVIFHKLWKGLWDRGLIESSDYLRPSVNTDMRSALSSAYAIEINEIKMIIAGGSN